MYWIFVFSQLPVRIDSLTWPFRSLLQPISIRLYSHLTSSMNMFVLKTEYKNDWLLCIFHHLTLLFTSSNHTNYKFPGISLVEKFCYRKSTGSDHVRQFHHAIITNKSTLFVIRCDFSIVYHLQCQAAMLCIYFQIRPHQNPTSTSTSTSTLPSISIKLPMVSEFCPKLFHPAFLSFCKCFFLLFSSSDCLGLPFCHRIGPATTS